MHTTASNNVQTKRAFFKTIRTHEEYSSKEKADIVRAMEFSARLYGDKLHKSGYPFIVHCIHLSNELLSIHADPTVLILAFLHDLPDYTEATLDEIKETFGHRMADLVSGVKKLGMLRIEDEFQQHEDLNHILFAMSLDIRIAILRLMHRLLDIRNMVHESDEFKILMATETSDIYVPLAGRLGLNKVKSELENISFKILYPEIHREIERQLQITYQADVQCLRDVQNTITQLLNTHEIKGKTAGRIKSAYSIYRKMVKRKIPYDEVYDKLAIRIILDEIPQCYEVLGLIHTHYSPIPGSFDDYIAMPKPNNYQSLHTAIYPIQGVSFKPVEIQIRTDFMNREAEFGAAAHWQYKSDQFLTTRTSAHIQWIKSLISLRDRLDNHYEFVEALKTSVFEESTIVFDKLGKVIYLPSKATVRDFADHLHIHCNYETTAVKINGEISSLNDTLKSGDTVEVVECHNVKSDYSSINL